MDLEKANQRLKLSCAGISIIQRGSKLSLRGMLPNKQSEGKSQQTIKLDIYANPAGIKRAFEEAKKASALLALKEFDWSLYRSTPILPKVVSEWISQFEQDYFTRRARTPQSETTWRGDYVTFFNKLPPDAPLTAELLKKAVIAVPPDTRSRQRACMVASALAKFALLDFDATPYSGNYSPALLTPRTLPTDAEIVEWREKIKDPRWQFVYGLMATYGLRNHEVFNLDLDSLKKEPGILAVLDGKTGARRVWPCHAAWWDEWHLWDINLIPVCNGKNNSILGNYITRHFKKYGFSYPYNLRHAWAVRTLELGLDVSLAAKQMGHSVLIHTSTYHHWIDDRTHQKAFEELVKRSSTY